MARVRTTNDLVLSILDFYRTAKNELDLKPGQVARDLFVDGQAVQFSKLYEENASTKTAQSLFLSSGSDLDALAKNYGETRKQGSKANGNALLTFSDIEADIPINKGSTVTASTGATFTVTSSFTVSVSKKNTYRATASKYRSALDFVGIEDQYAVEVLVEASSSGTSGNISKYSLKTTSISGVSNVTNPSAFSGGYGVENDSSFKRRISGVFSGSNTGTETGYRNTVLADPDVIDALVVCPGDDLMTRDGTVVYIAEDGTRTITSEGTGGKVDIYAHGFRLSEILDSYIYFDKSNKDDPTDVSNDFVLGQIASDVNKTVSRKRIDNITNKELPDQPVTNVLEVYGSSSGANFVEKTTDSLGVVTGNYELVYDDGVYAGSPWGFDRLRWIDDRVSNLPEDVTKGKFNSQDSTGFSDVTRIGSVKQNIQITNENSKILSSDRSNIQLSHWPISSVSRVFNQTTGERYIVSNQNPDGGSVNSTGRIIISGSTLPSVSDILQVDYIWILSYDPYWDFDNKNKSDNIRTVVDSIDWGYSNIVRREEVVITASGTQLVAEVTHPVNTVVSVNTFSTQSSTTVTLISNRLAVSVSNQVINVISVSRSSDLAEFYNTGTDDGSFSGGVIYLPTDTVAVFGDVVNVKYNAVDQFTVTDLTGSFNNTIITLPGTTTITAGTIVEVNYLTDTKQLIPATAFSNLPILRNGNYFKTGTATSFGVQPTTHIYSSGTIIQSNLKQAPTKLKLTVAGTISPGVVTVSGNSIQGVFEGVFTTSSSGLIHDLSSLLKKALGLNSNQSIPSTVGVVKLSSFEKVQVNANKDVLAIENTYDVFGYEINNNDFVKNEAIANSQLSAYQIKLPNTLSNQNNLPVLGDSFKVSFYINKTSDIENVSFSKSGTLYTQKTWLFVDSISISSGFTSIASQSATLTIAPQNQPLQGSRYTSYYDYLAPKPNERISIRYNKNQIITDCTFSVEKTRPITADVLLKATVPILVDMTLAIVLAPGYDDSSTVVVQNVKDAVTAAMNKNLGSVIDYSDFTTIAGGINGVDRVRSTHFNKKESAGSVLSIKATKKEYIQANDIVVDVETR